MVCFVPGHDNCNDGDKLFVTNIIIRIFMLRLEASRPRHVGLLVGWLVFKTRIPKHIPACRSGFIQEYAGNINTKASRKQPTFIQKCHQYVFFWLSI